jgi:ribosomal protein L11 methyltransferase
MRHFRVLVAPAEVDLVSGLAWVAGADGVEERGRVGEAPAEVDDLVAVPTGEAEEEPGPLVELLIATRDPAALIAELSDRWPLAEVAVDEGEWWEAWKPWARAVDLGPLVVAPPWVEVEPDRRVLRIDPGRTWGHGAHPTTHLVLDHLVRHPPADAAVLDAGCGSGVLGIAALLLGARSLRAVDVDPEAISATGANADTAAIGDRVSVAEASLADEAASGTSYDLVLANLDAPVLQANCRPLIDLTAPGGSLVLSGMLAGRSPSIERTVADAARAAGRRFDVVDRPTEAEWGAVVARLPEG